MTSDRLEASPLTSSEMRRARAAVRSDRRNATAGALLTTAALLALCGCDQKPTSTTTPSAAASNSAAMAAASATGSAAAMAKAPAVTRSAVEQLVTRWAATQNEGNFEAYSALYANPFEGIKRSGPRTAHFSRKGWLADRANMFKKKMEVKVSDVNINTSQAVARAVFTQRWSSGDYQDEGRKALVIVSEPGGLKLAREEMLNSTLLNAAPAISGGSGPAKSVTLVLEAGGPFLALPGSKLDESWLNGPPVRVNMRRVVTLRAPLDEAKLPETLKRWRGQKVRLMNAAGAACEGTVETLYAIGRVVPHFGTRAAWSGRDGAPPMKPAAIAKDAWGMARKLIAAEVKPAAGAKCTGALWAHEVSAAVPNSSLPLRVEGALYKKAVEAFRALPSYGQIQKSYATDFKPGKRWEEHGGGKLAVRSYKLGKARFVSVNARALAAGCDDFQSELMALWRVDGTPGAPELKLLNEPAGAGGMKLLGATEIDGKPAFLFDGFYKRGLLQVEGDKAAVTQALNIPFLDCEC